MKKRIQLAFWLLTLLNVTLVKLNAQTLPFSDPNNNGGWVLNQNVSDEFNAFTLDENKWFIQGKNGEFKNNFIGRAPSQFSPNNVSLNGQHLLIKSRWQPTYPFSDKLHLGTTPYEKVTTAAIISKTTFTHGYMEIRSKSADGPVSSAFWCIGNQSEIDVYEHFGKDPGDPRVESRMHTSFYDWVDPQSSTYGDRVWDNKHAMPFRTAADFHVYGLEWDPNFMKLYVDGRLIYCVTKAEVNAVKPNAWVKNDGKFVWVDSETFPFLVSSAELKASDFPNGGINFVVDYVRIWSRTNNGQCEAKTNLIQNPGFENNISEWTRTGNAGVITNNGSSYEGSKFIGVGSGSSGRVEQTVTVKPNTTYVLSAYVKSPGTNNSTKFDDSWIGVENYGGARLTTQFFKNYWHHKSIQFTTGDTNTTAKVFFTNQWSNESSRVDFFELYEAPLPISTPITSEKFYIVNRATGKRMVAENNNQNSKIIQGTTTTNIGRAQWEQVSVSGDWFHLRNVATGMYFRPQTISNGSSLIQKNTSSSGSYTQWKKESSTNNYFFLQNRETSKYIRPANNSNDALVEQRPNTFLGSYTQWQFISVNNGSLVSKINPSQVFLEAKTSNETSKFYQDKEYLFIELIKPDQVYTKVELYTTSGVLLSSVEFKERQASINISMYNKGVYVLKIEDKVNSITKKIMLK